MKITQTEGKKLGKYYNINFDIVPLNEWIEGLNIELEHGTKYGNLTNITNNNLKITGKIVIAHLLENPRYYYFLKKMEIESDTFWKNIKKPNIFIQ